MIKTMNLLPMMKSFNIMKLNFLDTFTLKKDLVSMLSETK